MPACSCFRGCIPLDRQNTSVGQAAFFDVCDVETVILFVQAADIIGIRETVQLGSISQREAVIFHELTDLLQFDAVDELHDGHPLDLFENAAQVFGRNAECSRNIGLSNRLAQMLKDILLGFLDVFSIMIRRKILHHTSHAVQTVEELKYQACAV